MVKDVKHDVMEVALVVPFIRVPEFGEVIAKDCINEEISEE